MTISFPSAVKAEAAEIESETTTYVEAEEVVEDSDQPKSSADTAAEKDLEDTLAEDEEPVSVAAVTYKNCIAEQNGIWHAYDANGQIIKGATPLIGGRKYFCPADGVLRSGWLYLGSWKMYFDPADTAAATGFKEINGKMYLFDENGVMQNFAGTTNIALNGKTGKYWFSTDYASLKTGWLNLGGMELYFDPETYAAYTNGAYKIGSDWYAFDENGILCKNATPLIGGKKYFCSSDGVLRSGWLYLGSWKMYFDTANYAAAIGFKEINGKMYLFDENGVMQNYAGTTNITLNGRTGKYWFSTDDASLKTGWLALGSMRLYFDPETYAACVNTSKIIDGKNLVFDENGCVKNYATVGTRQMYPSITAAVKALIEANPFIISSLENETIAFIDIHEGTYTEGVNLESLAGGEPKSASGLHFTGIGNVIWKSGEPYPTGCVSGYGACTFDNIHFEAESTGKNPAYAVHYEAGPISFSASNPGVLFRNCSFVSKDNAGIGVGMGKTNAKITFENCTFSGKDGKDIYFHNATSGGTDSNLITFRNCSAGLVYIFDAAKWRTDRTSKLSITFTDNDFARMLLDCGTRGVNANRKYPGIPAGYENFRIVNSSGNSNAAFDGD